MIRGHRLNQFKATLNILKSINKLGITVNITDVTNLVIPSYSLTGASGIGGKRRCSSTSCSSFTFREVTFPPAKLFLSPFALSMPWKFVSAATPCKGTTAGTFQR
jgi:hypothetical protein